MTEKLAYNPKEAAKVMGVSPPKAYDLIHSDSGFPVVRLGKRLIIPIASLESWLEKQATGSSR